MSSQFCISLFSDEPEDEVVRETGERMPQASEVDLMDDTAQEAIVSEPATSDGG